jgi:hypothetical protein
MTDDERAANAPLPERAPRFNWREAAAAALVLLVRIVTMPRTPWENDEFLFAEAVRKFDPSLYHPHPPGYPLFVLLGKAFAAFVGDPWRALVLLNVVAAPVGCIALIRAVRHWIGSEQIAIAASLLYFLSASMLLHGPLALSDAAAMSFVALAFAALSRRDDAEHERRAIETGLWLSAAIGCRPPLALPIAALFPIVLWSMRTNRQRVACVATFGFVSLMWFLPLMDAAGGFDKLMAYETKQAAYFAAHDAGMSRGARSAASIVIRFVLHPWGSKYLTLPLICLVALGVPALLRRWRPLLPLFVFTAVHLAFAILSMDPADAARYALPSMIFFALAAALGLEALGRSAHIPLVPIGGALLFAAASALYVGPILAARTRGPSPPFAAAAFANATYPPETVVLYDLSLRPHAEYLMPRFHPAAMEKGLADHYDQPGVPLVLFTDGGSKSPRARTFAWPACDAYGKLTRGFYREVTVEPMPPGARFLPLAGVYPLEHSPAGDAWRWLAPEAAIRLPGTHARKLAITMALSHDAPYDTNRVRLFVNGHEAGEVSAARTPAGTVIELPESSSVEVRFVAEKSFSPAKVLGNRDPRTLAVQLVGVETR